MERIFRASSPRGGESDGTSKAPSKVAAKPLPPLERLQELFDYCPSTGQLIRLKSLSSNARKGDTAGSPHSAGYLQIQVDGQKWLVHRIIWALQTGDDPGEMEVDHKDGDRSNNTWSNLRLATAGQNRANRLARGFHRRGNRFFVAHRHKYVGIFKTETEARLAYENACDEHAGVYAGHRR